MPELPEVETIRRDLAPELEGRRITAIRIHHHDIIIGAQSSAEFRRRVEGRRILAVDRRAKWLLLQLDIGVLITQLRMTGRFAVGRGTVPPLAGFRHVAAEFDLNDGRTLFYDDSEASCCSPSLSGHRRNHVSARSRSIPDSEPSTSVTLSGGAAHRSRMR